MLLAACGATAGCQRAATPQFATAEAMSQLDPEMQTAVQEELRKRCGTPDDLKLIGGTPQEEQQLNRVPRSTGDIASNVTE